MVSFTELIRSELTVQTMNILLTGRPRIGKTTVIKRVLERVGTDRIDGFWSEEIREHGKRVGFGIATISGQTGILAHVRLGQGPRVGKYYVNIADIENIIVPTLIDAKASGKIILIDEIAKMELYSKKFAQVVLDCLDTGRVLGTIQIKRTPYLHKIRNRSDCRVIEVTLTNRDDLPERIYSLIMDA